MLCLFCFCGSMQQYVAPVHFFVWGRHIVYKSPEIRLLLPEYHSLVYLILLCRRPCQDCKSSSVDGCSRSSYLCIYNKLPPGWPHISDAYIYGGVPGCSNLSGKLWPTISCHHIGVIMIPVYVISELVVAVLLEIHSVKRDAVSLGK